MSGHYSAVFLLGVFVGVILAMAIVSFERHRKLVRQARRDHTDAELKATINRAWAAIDAGERVTREELRRTS